MDQSVKAQNFRLLQTAKRLNEQYHIYAVSRGLSDPAANILYTLMEPDGVITQNDLAIMWCYPKQTVNFTIQGLVKKGYVQLEQLPGGRNRKSVSLTAKGQAYCREVLTPLIEAEERSLLRLSEKERALMVELGEKQCAYFEDEIQKMTKEKEQA